MKIYLKLYLKTHATASV